MATKDCLEGIDGCILVSDWFGMLEGIEVRVNDGLMEGMSPNLFVFYCLLSSVGFPLGLTLVHPMCWNRNYNRN